MKPPVPEFRGGLDFFFFYVGCPRESVFGIKFLFVIFFYFFGFAAVAVKMVIVELVHNDNSNIEVKAPSLSSS